MRRLLNTSMELPKRYREDVVDKHGIKLLTSGYSMEQVRRILMGGMKGYVSKNRRRPVHGRRRIHNTLEESLQGRIKKKLLGRTSWYKKRGSKEQQNLKKIQGGALKTTSKELKTRAVLFVEQTPNGELSKRIKELLQRLEPVLGYRLRVVERTGRSLGSLLAQTSIWRGLTCGREPCITCTQGGEEVPSCTRSSIVYENICIRCNPSATNKGELREQYNKTPSLYVGESSRTIQERGSEH